MRTLGASKTEIRWYLALVLKGNGIRVGFYVQDKRTKEQYKSFTEKIGLRMEQKEAHMRTTQP